MSHEDLDNITKERDGYRVILDFLLAGDCPEHGEDWNCVKDQVRCSDCLIDYAREEVDKIREREEHDSHYSE